MPENHPTRPLSTFDLNTSRGRYQARLAGHVVPKRMPSKAPTPFWSLVDKTGECWIFTGCIAYGYGRYSYRGVEWQAHRFAWVDHFQQLIPDGMCVCHRCDNPPCVRPDHLFLGTNLDNIADMMRKNRQPTGSGCHNAKLTEGDVADIRRLYRPSKGGAGRASEYSAHGLARRFGVTPDAIYRVLWRDNWK